MFNDDMIPKTPDEWFQALTPEKVKEFRQINNMPFPLEKFTEHGVKFDLPHIEQMSINNLLYPVQITMAYADKFTQHTVDNHILSDLEQMIPAHQKMLDNIILHGPSCVELTAVAIGNLAYIGFNSKSPTLQKCVREIYFLLLRAMIHEVRKARFDYMKVVKN